MLRVSAPTIGQSAGNVSSLLPREFPPRGILTPNRSFFLMTQSSIGTCDSIYANRRDGHPSHAASRAIKSRLVARNVFPKDIPLARKRKICLFKHGMKRTTRENDIRSLSLSFSLLRMVRQDIDVQSDAKSPAKMIHSVSVFETQCCDLSIDLSISAGLIQAYDGFLMLVGCSRDCFDDRSVIVVDHKISSFLMKHGHTG